MRGRDRGKRALHAPPVEDLALIDDLFHADRANIGRMDTTVMRSPLLGRALAGALVTAGVAALGACADHPVAPPPPPVLVAFVEEPGGLARIDVTTTGRHALARVELLMPDGRATVGDVVDHQAIADRAPGGGPFDVGVGVFGGSSSRVGGGVSIGFPILGGGRAVAPMIRSRARVAVPDVEAYRRDWPQARIRLSFTAGPEDTRVDATAPSPAARVGASP
ncbi:MAG: hypothetical protein JNK67_09860 [Alphaproteobacteria bacterium]|nr:hypothetical protein [Alphaproteobacteria bacterium]